MKKILLLGPLPPPLGGISVFLKRYKYQLEKEGHHVDVLDLFSMTKFQRLRMLLHFPLQQYDIIQLNYYSLKLPAFFWLRGVLNKTQWINHGWRERSMFGRFEKLAITATNFFLKRCRDFVLVSPHQAEFCKHNGIVLPKNIKIQSPFLPPPLEEEKDILKTFPSSVKDFIENRHPLLTANAFQIAFFNEEDLYGLDLCVELTHRLKKDFPNIGFLFALANETVHTDYLEKIKTRIQETGIEDNFCFMTGQREIWPLFKKATLALRPTNTDGNSVTIHEAIYFDCPILASDVCPRPPKTVLFKNRDIEDLYEKSKNILISQST